MHLDDCYADEISQPPGRLPSGKPRGSSLCRHSRAGSEHYARMHAVIFDLTCSMQQPHRCQQVQPVNGSSEAWCLAQRQRLADLLCCEAGSSQCCEQLQLSGSTHGSADFKASGQTEDILDALCVSHRDERDVTRCNQMLGVNQLPHAYSDGQELPNDDHII